MTRAIAFQKVYSGFAHANRLHKRCLQACKHFSGTAKLKSGRPSDSCGSQGPNVGAAARPSLIPPPPMAGPAAARVISGTRTFDLTLLLHEDLQHWLDIAQRITFKLCLLVY